MAFIESAVAAIVGVVEKHTLSCRSPERQVDCLPPRRAPPGAVIDRIISAEVNTCTHRCMPVVLNGDKLTAMHLLTALGYDRSGLRLMEAWETRARSEEPTRRIGCVHPSGDRRRRARARRRPAARIPQLPVQVFMHIS